MYKALWPEDIHSVCSRLNHLACVVGRVTGLTEGMTFRPHISRCPMAFQKSGYKTSAVHVFVPVYPMVVMSRVLRPTAMNTTPWGSGVGAPDGAPW